MAHFYGIVKGNKGEESRCGTKSSGLLATAQGWDIGGKVRIDHIQGRDVVTLGFSGGSNYNYTKLLPPIYLDHNGDVTSDDPLMRELLKQAK